MPVTTLFIDLDDTLYPASSGLWSLIRQRIDQYMVERLHYPSNQVSEIRRTLFQSYGTTMRGLQATTHLDEADFLAYVHDVPVEKMIRASKNLRAILEAYPQHKVIFTNADRRHALRVIKALELDGIFDQIVDIVAITPYCKPQPGAFLTALRLSGETDPGHCLVIDDAARNLQAARDLGFNTLLVQESPGELPVESQTSFPSITYLADLPRYFPPSIIGSPTQD